MSTFVEPKILGLVERELLGAVKEIQGEEKYRQLREKLLLLEAYRREPENLAHYCKTGELDLVIMGELESTVALCGHVFRASDRGFAGVDSYAEARKPGKRVCPVCSEIYQGRPC